MFVTPFLGVMIIFGKSAQSSAIGIGSNYLVTPCIRHGRLEEKIVPY
jgi:hypothetical protein